MVQVAVKFITASTATGRMNTTVETVQRRLTEEAENVARARRGIVSKNLLCEVHGVAVGELPDNLIRPFRVADFSMAIVMRLETGGSLKTRLYPPLLSALPSLTTLEKMFIGGLILRGGRKTC